MHGHGACRFVIIFQLGGRSSILLKTVESILSASVTDACLHPNVGRLQVDVLVVKNQDTCERSSGDRRRKYSRDSKSSVLQLHAPDFERAKLGRSPMFLFWYLGVSG